MHLHMVGSRPDGFCTELARIMTTQLARIMIALATQFMQVDVF